MISTRIHNFAVIIDMHYYILTKLNYSVTSKRSVLLRSSKKLHEAKDINSKHSI